MPANPRDEKILEHLGRYRISLRPILEREFFDGKNSGNVIQRLLKSEKIHSRTGLPNRIRYYQLTASEARKRSVPVGRSDPFAAQALNLHLGVLWFCCVEKPTCQRAEEKALAAHFKSSPKGPLCVERTDQGHALWHMRVATPDTEDTNLIRNLRTDVADGFENPELIDPLTSGQFGFVVLVDTEARKVALEKSLADQSFTNDVTVEVHVAPSHETLAQALREL